MKSENRPIVLRRTRAQFEQAMKNANCSLFEAIARWVLQDYNYLSMDILTKRIKELEERELKDGFISSLLRN